MISGRKRKEGQTMKKIYSELSRIQQELKAPKNLYNSFGKYSYRNAEGILEAVKPLLGGLALVINDEPVLIGDRFYIKATVTLTDGEENVSAVAYAREDETKKGMDGCQITGACSSYARKYALNALLMIDDAKDSDDDSLSPKNPKNSGKEAQEYKPAGEPFTPPKSGAAEVTTAGKVLEMSPEMKYLGEAMKELREARGISAAENKELFKNQKIALVDSGLAPDKDIQKYTLQELKNLIDAMWKNFAPTGTEVKS